MLVLYIGFGYALGRLLSALCDLAILKFLTSRDIKAHAAENKQRQDEVLAFMEKIVNGAEQTEEE